MMGPIQVSCRVWLSRAALIALPVSAMISLTTGILVAQTDSSKIGSDGTAYVTRVVPVPRTISPEARRVLSRPASDVSVPETLAQRRSHTDEWQNRTGKLFQAMYPTKVEETTIAGVPVRVITPVGVPQFKPDRVLINLHGGGFNSDSGSLTESVPVAYLSKTKVVAVLYGLAPEHPFPAGLDDAVSVYRELLKTYQPEKIGVFGTSAGAILTGELAVKLRESKLPMPQALGIFSGMGDFSTNTDSAALYALNGFSGHLDPPQEKVDGKNEYAGKLPLTDPSLSILYADLHGLPSTLFITSGRDMLLSGTTILQRAFLRAGDDTQLVVFEALPHAFWNDPALPETKEADEIMARFFDTKLGR